MDATGGRFCQKKSVKLLHLFSPCTIESLSFEIVTPEHVDSSYVSTLCASVCIYHDLPYKSRVKFLTRNKKAFLLPYSMMLSSSKLHLQIRREGCDTNGAFAVGRKDALHNKQHISPLSIQTTHNLRSTKYA
jgi:hypothetical protein